MLGLPNELIAQILAQLAEGPEIKGSAWPLQTSVHAWLSLAQTCRRVHEVAVSTQQLWQRIVIFSKTVGLYTAFSRSGDLEIDVIFHLPDIIPSSFMLLAPHAARVRTLVIIKADRDTHSALRFLFARPMPALTTCQVHLLHRGIPRHRPGEGMYWTVNHTLAPNLHTLQLGALSFDWKSEMVPHLRRLSLWNSFPRAFLPFDRFLDVLQSCTLLEHLEIRHCPPFITPVPHTPRSAALPRLRTLVLDAYDYMEVSALLSHLQLGEHADVAIHLDIDTDVEEDAALTLPQIVSTDPARLPLLASAASATLAFHGFLLVECAAPAGTPGRLHAFLNPGSATDVDEGWRYTPSVAVGHFCELLVRAPLRALQLQLEWPYAGEACAAAGMFANVFQAFPELEELGYGGDADEESDRQLLDALAGGDALPRLRVLRLELWNEELVPSLAEVLRVRAMRGSRLSQLDIQLVDGVADVPSAGLLPASELEASVRQLRELVDGDVKWDGDTSQSNAVIDMLESPPPPRHPILVLRACCRLRHPANKMSSGSLGPL